LWGWGTKEEYHSEVLVYLQKLILMYLTHTIFFTLPVK